MTQRPRGSDVELELRAPVGDCGVADQDLPHLHRVADGYRPCVAESARVVVQLSEREYVAGDLAYNLKFVQPQGRYLFPALIPIAVFYVCGFAFMFGGMADAMSPNNSGIATMGGYAGLNHELGFHIGGKFLCDASARR